MVSIIICSRNLDLFDNLKLNIGDTIGNIEFELLRIDNENGKLSIAQAYNNGLLKSKYDIVLFVHEDVIFLSQGWGKEIQQLFLDNEIGVLGLAGAKYKSRLPLPWWECGVENRVIYLRQNENSLIRYNEGFNNRELEEVILLDGVFLAFRKSNGLQFDERLSGFHHYDTGICLRHIQHGFKNFVTNKILLEHSSGGRINKDWFDSTEFIHHYYKPILPLQTPDAILSADLEDNLAYNNVLNNFDLKNYKYALKVWKSYFISKPLSIFHFRITFAILKRRIKL